MLIPPADSGELAIGVQIRAAQGTGARIGSTGTAAPSFITYVRIPSGTTTLPATPLTRGISFQTFVSQAVPAADPSLLAIGGAPSARSLIRFPWSTFIRDSARLMRASLELVPTAPVHGLKGDTAFMQVRPLLADFGGKSPAGHRPVLSCDRADGLLGRATPCGSRCAARPPSGRRTVRAAAGADAEALPRGQQLHPSHLRFEPDPGFAPRLRMTYVLKFPFEAP